MASTPTVDRVGDVVNPLGLTSRGPVPLLLNHKSDQPVGTVHFGTATAKGLPFTAKIAKVPEDGEVKSRTDSAWHSVKAGLVKGVSIGFIPDAAHTVPLKSGGQMFNKAEVHELSLTAIPANPDAIITSYKSAEPRTFTNTHPEQSIHNKALTAQVRRALAMSEHDAAIAAITKAAVPAGTTVTYGSGTPLGGLYYPGQVPGVIQPPATVPIVMALAQLGAAQLPVNTRILTQGAIISASEIAEGTAYPAAAPNVAVTLQGNRKFGLILALSSEMFRLDPSDQVIEYVQSVLTCAHGIATDAAFYAQLSGAAQTAAYQSDAASYYETTVESAMDGFEGDLRTAAWIAAPATLAKLRSPINKLVGPAGGTYYDMPCVSSLAIPAGKVLLVDIARTAVFDGPEEILRGVSADLVMDSDPASVSGTPGTIQLFQQDMIALRVTKFADMQTLVQPTLISLS